MVDVKTHTLDFQYQIEYDQEPQNLISRQSNRYRELRKGLSEKAHQGNWVRLKVSVGAPEKLDAAVDRMRAAIYSWRDATDLTKNKSLNVQSFKQVESDRQASLWVTFIPLR